MNTPRVRKVLAVCLGMAAGCSTVWGEPIPISAFARLPIIDDVGISHDGRYLSWLSPADGALNLVVFDRRPGGEMKRVMGPPKQDEFRLDTCKWANNTRLLCTYEKMEFEAGGVVYPIRRLVAVNADGTDLKVLMQKGRAGDNQHQDRIIDWSPDDPDTVLIQGDDDRNGYPSVFKLNVFNGKLSHYESEQPPIEYFESDSKGRVRFGWGLEGKRYSYFAKLEDGGGWKKLTSFVAYSETDMPTPLAISPGRNKVFATGNSKGRRALWELDLSDKDRPVLLFEHPQVDADDILWTRSGRMLGIYYETDKPAAFYTDEKALAVIEAAKRLLPAGNFNTVVDVTPDEQTYIIRSTSDVDDGTYAVLDLAAKSFKLVGAAYPELMKRENELGRMKSITYKASDGTEIPGYLTVPPGHSGQGLPLIVMPHGGPHSRDSWYFSWLLQFLVNRGYAVLQMNFRGSTGYGYEWQFAAHQDWGGITYSDITDATRWAIKEGIADPRRICIVGWSYGGYAALLGAVRNSDLYKCAASIAGVSDLIALDSEERIFEHRDVFREQIGTNREKLKADSPRRHASSVSIPVLMVHGNRDYQVRFGHSNEMAGALKAAKKDHKLIKIEGADHQLSREADRVTLLTELEAFLKANL